MATRTRCGVVLAGLVVVSILTAACGGAAPAKPAAPAAPAAPSAPSSTKAPAPSAPAAASTLTPMTIAYAAVSASQAAAWVAQDQGFFTRNGLKVSLVSIAGGSSPTAALISNHIQALQISLEVLEADLSGAHLVYVAAPLSLPLLSLVAQPSIHSGAQLRGQKIGMTGVGTLTYFVDQIALQHFGLSSHDVNLIKLGSLPSMLGALQSHQIGAAPFSMPLLAKAEQAGFPVLLDFAKAGVRFPNSWVAMTQSYVQAHPKNVAALVRSITEAVAFEKQHPNQTMKIISRYTHLTNPALLKAAYDATAPNLNREPVPLASEVQVGLNLLAQAGYTKAKTAKASDFVDPSFVQNLQQSGAIARLYSGG